MLLFRTRLMTLPKERRGTGSFLLRKTSSLTTAKRWNGRSLPTSQIERRWSGPLPRNNRRLIGRQWSGHLPPPNQKSPTVVQWSGPSMLLWLKRVMINQGFVHLVVAKQKSGRFLSKTIVARPRTSHFLCAVQRVAKMGIPLLGLQHHLYLRPDFDQLFDMRPQCLLASQMTSHA